MPAIDKKKRISTKRKLCVLAAYSISVPDAVEASRRLYKSTNNEQKYTHTHLL